MTFETTNTAMGSLNFNSTPINSPDTTWSCMHQFLTEFKTLLDLIKIQKFTIFGGFVRELIKKILPNPHKHFLEIVDADWTPEFKINDIDMICGFKSMKQRDKIFNCLRTFGYTFVQTRSPVYNGCKNNTTYAVRHRNWMGQSFNIDIVDTDDISSLDFTINGFELDLISGDCTHRTTSNSFEIYKIIDDWKNGKVSFYHDFNRNSSVYEQRVAKMINREVDIIGLSINKIKLDEIPHDCSICTKIGFYKSTCCKKRLCKSCTIDHVNIGC